MKYTFNKILERFAYTGQFKLENFLPGMRGENIGSSLSDIDLSGVTTVELPTSTTIGGSTVSALGNVTSTGSAAFTVAATGPSNYGLQVDESTASAKTGIKITAAASGSGVAVLALGGGAGEDLTIDSKASGSTTGRLKLNTLQNADVLIAGTGSQADFQIAEVTGGTGTTATLKATGNAAGGPTTAAQDGWMKVKIAGTQVWLPVWK